MKFWVLLGAALLLLSGSALGDLSVADWQKLTEMFRESEARMQAALKESEAQMQQTIKDSEARTNMRIEREARVVRDRFGDVNGRLNFISGLLIALVVAALGLPFFRERKKEREQDEKIAAQQELIEAQQAQLEAQQQEMEAVREELATLKQN